MAEEKFKVWWDEENKIVRVKFQGDQEENDARGMAEEIIRLIKEKTEKSSILYDMTETKKASSGARKVYAELAGQERLVKSAFFGLSIFTKTIISFVMSAAKKEKMRFFTTEAEALAWLKEGE